MIHRISPEDTPFMSNAGRGKAQQTFFEWQTDELSSPNTSNTVVEGDDVSSFDAVTPTVRLGNYTQISRKTLVLSETEEVVNKAGRKSEEAYQKAKKSAELKRDMEAMLLANNGAVAGDDSTPRETGSLLAFVKTNVDKAGDGANPSYTNIPTGSRTDGTQRAFTEPLLKNVVAGTWAEGGKPTTVMVGAFNKQVASGFSGIATKNINQTAAKAATIIGAADIYVSDFGVLQIVPNRFQRARDAHVLDFDLVEVMYLRPFKWTPLAKTGDSRKHMLVVEYGLKVKQEKGLGLVADLTTS